MCIRCRKQPTTKEKIFKSLQLIHVIYQQSCTRVLLVVYWSDFEDLLKKSCLIKLQVTAKDELQEVKEIELVQAQKELNQMQLYTYRARCGSCLLCFFDNPYISR